MRPPAIEKMGYYPTDEPVIEAIQSYIVPAASRARLFDPCAGEGRATSRLGKALNCETWGVELSPERAAKAEEVLDKVYQAPWQACFLTDESISCLFLNPPYEHDRFDDQKRLELEFLKTTTPKLVRGGLLVYIVPQRILGMPEIARLLAGHYENTRIVRFPDGLFDKFQQVVVFATRRSVYKVPGEGETGEIMTLANSQILPIQNAPQPLYELLSAPVRGANSRPVVFKRMDWEPEEVVEATRKAGVQTTAEWLDLINPSRALTQLTQPVMPLKKGHVAMLMASGMMGTVRLTDEEGLPMLIKGRVIKVVEKSEETDSKDSKVVVETYKDRFVTTVAVLKQDGVQIIQDVKGLSDFMKAHGEKIAAHVLETYRPLYNLDPTVEETTILDTLGTERKPLPGQERAGLLPTQRHVAAALARSIRKNGVANCQSEMGTGKASWNQAKVYTNDGYKLMGEIRVGDMVIGADGEPVEVIGVYPQGLKDIYRVTFTDGSFTHVTEDHLWEVNTPLRKWRTRPPKVMTTGEMLQHRLKHANGNHQLFIPMIGPVQFSPREIPLDPYILGLLIGDGCLVNGTPCISTGDPEILNSVIQFANQNGLRVVKKDKYDYAISGPHLRNPIGRFITGLNPLTQALKQLGIWDKPSGEKFIPEIYRYNTVEIRLEILRGILDSDGSVDARGNSIDFSTVSKTLAEHVKEVVQSLGGTATFTEKSTTGQKAYRAFLSLPGWVRPFRLSRKAQRYIPHTKYQPSRAVARIDYIGKDLATCIKDNDSRELYATDEFILTHNTTMSAAVIELLHAYPALIVCPPHLVPKWIREIEEVIPGAKARELRRIGRNSDELADVNDVRDFLQEYQEAASVAKQYGMPAPKWVAVVAHTSAKFGTGWRPAVGMRKTQHPLTGKVVNACACPACGKIVTKDEDGFEVPVMASKDLADKRRFCTSQVAGWQLDARKRRKLDDSGEPIWSTRACGHPLFEFSGARRHSIAEYIAKHAKGEFKLLVADEVHQFKGKASDRGVAFHQLITAAKWTLTLTGTFFGGKSTSIFWLLHRLNAGVRRDFAFQEEKRWARLYGVLETQRRRRRDEDDDDGVYTGNRRYRNQAKEQPGVSPAIVSRLLDTTVFLSLKDLNLALPAYKEEVVSLEMLDDQGDQYRSMETALKQLAIQSRRYLSTWLQWSLARPNSAFRDEAVVVDEVDNENGETVRKVTLMELPAINPNGHKWLPKENWLASFCKAEKQQGRKVLVYVRQTGTRDIQDRVELPLQASGLRVQILGGNVDPRKREDWIAKRVNGMDVMICNPRLVETGLDLIQFSTVVFFEPEYSLYTLWQSVRRVWRLGQTQPVKAVFAVYNSAMEAAALRLMGRKMVRHEVA